MSTIDPLRPDRVPEATFVRSVEHLAEASSTNEFALQRAAEFVAPQLPCLIVTDRQTAGRGRGANRWWSDGGSLTFSLLLEPAALGIPTERWPALSLTVGAAVARGLETFAPVADVRLKWPNDVLIDGRKACGILIEAPPSVPGRLVIGIGINLNVDFSGAPADVRARAVSLHEVASGPVGREEVLIEVLRQLEQHFELLAGSDVRLCQAWRELCLLTGRSVVIDDVGRTVAGTCLGIDDDAALRVQTGVAVERLFSGVVVEW